MTSINGKASHISLAFLFFQNILRPKTHIIHHITKLKKIKAFTCKPARMPFQNEPNVWV